MRHVILICQRKSANAKLSFVTESCSGPTPVYLRFTWTCEVEVHCCTIGSLWAKWSFSSASTPKFLRVRGEQGNLDVPKVICIPTMLIFNTR